MKTYSKALVVTGVVLFALAFIGLILYALLYLYGWLEFEYTEKVTSLSPEFVSMVSERFGIDIPERAEFIGGEYSPAMAQDPTVEFAFSLDVSDGGLAKKRGETSDEYIERVISSMVPGTFCADTFYGLDVTAKENYGIEIGYTYRVPDDDSVFASACINCTDPVDGVIYYFIVCWY